MKRYIYLTTENNEKHYYLSNLVSKLYSPIVERVIANEEEEQDLVECVDYLNKAIAMGMNPLKKIFVISHPDWNGGAQHGWYFAESYPTDQKGNPELEDFEYLKWTGTLEEFLIKNPVFVDHFDDCWQIDQRRHDEKYNARDFLRIEWFKAVEKSFTTATEALQQLCDSWDTKSSFTAWGWVRNQCPLQAFIRASEEEQKARPFDACTSYWIYEYGLVNLEWLKDVFATYVLGYAQEDPKHALFESSDAINWAKTREKKE
jgi:hypothetical protein